MTRGGPTARLAVGRQGYARGGRKMSAAKRGCGTRAERGSGALARAARGSANSTWDGIGAAPAQPGAVPIGPSGQCEEPGSAGRCSSPECVPPCPWSAVAARDAVAAALTDGTQGALRTHCHEAWASATSARTLQNVRARRFMVLASLPATPPGRPAGRLCLHEGTMPRSCAARERGIPDPASGDPHPRLAAQHGARELPIGARHGAARVDRRCTGRHGAGPADRCSTTALGSRTRPVDPALPFS